MLEIDVGTSLLAQVTQCTMDSMELQEGLKVVCLIKSNAIQVLGSR